VFQVEKKYLSKTMQGPDDIAGTYRVEQAVQGSRVRRLDGDEPVSVALSTIAVGDRIRVLPGQRIPIDGRVVAGVAELDRRLYSGESAAVAVGPGEDVHAGERALAAALDIDVQAVGGKRRIDQLARQVRSSLASKPPWQGIADTVARWFLWLSLIAALIGAALALLTGQPAVAAAERALAVFVIACPCALSLAAPLSGLMASSHAASHGMILRDLNALTVAARPDVLFFDKTGTLTEGQPSLVDARPASGTTRDTLLHRAAIAEADADHPLADAIRDAADRPTATGRSISIAGAGLKYVGDDTEILVGKPQWLASLDIDLPGFEPSGLTDVVVAENGRYLGHLVLDDALKPDAVELMSDLTQRGIRCAVLSGDAAGPVQRVADALGIDGYAGLSPEDKAARIQEAQSADLTVAFAGDGLNDGPALAAADLGVAVAHASDAAQSASAVTFVDADVARLPLLFDLTARTRRVIRQNIAWAVIYNGVAIPAAMFGLVHPAVAACAMALSSLTIVLNAYRLH